MRIYTNTRAWRAHMLMWLFLAFLAGAIAMAIFGMISGNEAGTILGLTFTVFMLICVLGMEFYCQRYVTALDMDGDELVVHSRSLTGAHEVRGSGTLGDMKRDNPMSMDRATRMAYLTDSLRPLQMAAVDNSYHMLALAPHGRKYIVDVTADPEVGKRIAKALKDMQRKQDRR